MNKEYILWNLKEAQKELSSTIKEIENDQDYEYGNFIVAMTHLYHHVNTAWNAQGESKEVTEKCSEKDFEKWRLFPNDVDMSC